MVNDSVDQEGPEPDGVASPARGEDIFAKIGDKLPEMTPTQGVEEPGPGRPWSSRMLKLGG